MKRYKSIILTISIFPLFLSACLFPSDRNNPYDYKNKKTGWSSPVRIDNPASNYVIPEWISLGMSRDGTAIAAWREKNMDSAVNRYRIFVNKVHANLGSTWEGVLQIDGAADTTNCDYPQVAVNQSGQAVVEWIEIASDMTNTIFVKSYDNGEWVAGSWTDVPGGPVASSSHTYNNLSIAMNDSFVGAVVAWNEDTVGIHGAAYMSNVDSTWHTVAPVSSSIQPVAGITNEYATILVPYNPGSSQWFLYDHSVKLDGTNLWGYNEIYDGSIGAAGNKEPLNPEMDIDVNGNGIYVWCLQGNNYLYANTTIPNDFSDTSSTIANTQAQITDAAVNTPVVALNKYGDSRKAVIIYQTSDGHLMAAMLSFNTDMSIKIDSLNLPIDNPDLTPCIGQDVAIDANGNAIAIWEQDDRIWANRYDVIKTGWGVPEVISNGGDVTINSGTPVPYLPRVAMSADGYAVAIWRENDYINARVYRP